MVAIGEYCVFRIQCSRKSFLFPSISYCKTKPHANSNNFDFLKEVQLKCREVKENLKLILSLGKNQFLKLNQNRCRNTLICIEV